MGCREPATTVPSDDDVVGEPDPLIVGSAASILGLGKKPATR
jgi:hypothetical protein